MRIIQVEKSPIFAFRWNSIDSFSMIEKLSCCVQVDQKKRDIIAWNQIAEGKDEAINSKEGEGKTEYVDKIHPQKQNNNGQEHTLDWIVGHRTERRNIVVPLYTGGHTPSCHLKPV